jgi:acyl-CoA dehydrogenase
MDFSIPDKVTGLVADFRAFLEERVIPLEAQLSEGGSFLAMNDALEGVRDEVRAQGWWAPHFHAEHGGMGLSLMEFAHVSEVLGRSPLGHYIFGCQAPDVGNMEILAQFGTPAQKERWLGPLASGRVRSCFTMTEPGSAGSNPVLLETTAVLDGDEWVINGRKWFATSADGAAFAIAMVVTDPEAESPYMRASQIIVPTDTPGYELVRNINVMGEPGDGWASHGEVLYTDCRVPKENLLGARAGGFVIAQERLGPGRIHHCMRWLGICERSFELMCTRAATRMIADGKPLGTRQMVQQWIAESRAEINSARLSVLHAAWTIDKSGSHAARNEISMIKFQVAGILMRVLDRALQTHGALGMTDETPIAWWFRHERAARIYDGPDEVHKGAIARRILRKYGM